MFPMLLTRPVSVAVMPVRGCRMAVLAVSMMTVVSGMLDLMCVVNVLFHVIVVIHVGVSAKVPLID